MNTHASPRARLLGLTGSFSEPAGSFFDLAGSENPCESFCFVGIEISVARLFDSD